MHFDYAYLLLEEPDDAALDGYGDDDLVPTMQQEVLAAIRDEEEEEEDYVVQRHIRVLTVWNYVGRAPNATALLLSLPKAHPTQEVWILDAADAVEAVVRGTPEECAPYTSQVFLFRPMGEVLDISEIYSIPGNAKVGRKALVVTRQVAVYNATSDEIQDRGWWRWEEKDEDDEDEDDDLESTFIRRRSDLRNITMELVVEDSQPSCFMDRDVKPGEITVIYYHQMI